MIGGRACNWAVAATAAVGASCATTDQTDHTPPELAPTVGELAQAFNERLEHLQTLHMHGVVELEWRDERGDHWEQGDIDLWLRLPRHTAVRIHKVAEDLLWVGSDERGYWLFDLLGDETSLLLGRHDQAIVAQGGAFTVRPLALLDLIALSPIRPEGPLDVAAPFDVERNAWRLEGRHDSTSVRLYLHRDTRRPVRVELLDDDGNVALTCRLSRYDTVEFADYSHRDVRLAEVMAIRDEQGRGAMTIFLDYANDGIVDDSPFDRLFNLDMLRRRFRPDRIEGELPASGSSGS